MPDFRWFDGAAFLSWLLLDMFYPTQTKTEELAVVILMPAYILARFWWLGRRDG